MVHEGCAAGEHSQNERRHRPSEGGRAAAADTHAKASSARAQAPAGEGGRAMVPRSGATSRAHAPASTDRPTGASGRPPLGVRELRAVPLPPTHSAAMADGSPLEMPLFTHSRTVDIDDASLLVHH